MLPCPITIFFVITNLFLHDPALDSIWFTRLCIDLLIRAPLLQRTTTVFQDQNYRCSRLNTFDNEPKSSNVYEVFRLLRDTSIKIVRPAALAG